MEKDQTKAAPKKQSPAPEKAKSKTKPKTAPKKPLTSKAKSKALVARKPSAVDKPMNLEVLIAKAIMKGNLDVVERLLAVRKQLKDEFAEEQFFADMSTFQAECPIVLRREEVKKGDTVRFRYAPVATIVEETKELLKKHGFSTTYKQDDSKQSEGFVTVTAFAHHIAGHTESSTVMMPTGVATSGHGEAIMNEQQQVASARMYALRIAHCNVYGILTADWDDAAEGAGKIAGQPPGVKASKKPAEETVPINTLCDRILNKLRSGIFSEGERFTLENRIMEVYKKKNIKNMVAFEENIDRQIKFKRKQQNGSSEGS